MGRLLKNDREITGRNIPTQEKRNRSNGTSMDATNGKVGNAKGER